jgi:hypothetical protein
MIPGTRFRRATLRGFEGAGLVESASAVLRNPGGRFHCSGTLPDQDGSGVAFFPCQANIRFSAQTLMECE